MEYDFDIYSVDRSGCHSSCAALAYLITRPVEDQRRGETFFCSDSCCCVPLTGTILPKGAPAGWKDPAVLFNENEKNEKTWNVCTAKEIVIDPPPGADLVRMQEAVEEYIRETLTCKGYAATYAVHTDQDGNILYVYILIPARQIDPRTGTWAKKKRRWQMDQSLLNAWEQCCERYFGPEDQDGHGAGQDCQGEVTSDLSLIFGVPGPGRSVSIQEDEGDHEDIASRKASMYSALKDLTTSFDKLAAGFFECLYDFIGVIEECDAVEGADRL